MLYCHTLLFIAGETAVEGGLAKASTLLEIIGPLEASPV